MIHVHFLCLMVQVFPNSLIEILIIHIFVVLPQKEFLEI